MSTQVALRMAAVSLAASLLATAVVPGSATAATPVDGGPITMFPVAINAGAGDQYDPHVSGDFASYTSDDTVHYYDFFSGLDATVETSPDSKDELSDVSNGRIVFSRLDLPTFQQDIRIFDIGSQNLGSVDPQSSPPHRAIPAIGNGTVAYLEYAAWPGDIVATRLAGSSTRLSADDLYEQEPAISPDGNVVVYEKCGPTLGDSCDIQQAVWNGSGWTGSSLTANTEREGHPDTDGTTIVYDAMRSGEPDIRWQPVSGGAEQVLSLPGDQRQPSIAGGVALFQSIAVGDTTADLFLYELATNRLFRVTSTPADETLSDIAILPDGSYRIVWTSGDERARDVYGATIVLPPAGATYHFSGFASPVDGLPTLNQMKAGAAVPVKFGLGGSFGPSIFASGYPRSQVVACDSAAPVDGVELTVGAGASGLTYDTTTGLYTYVWKTDKGWAGTCRQLVLAFADGSIQRADFLFK